VVERLEKAAAGLDEKYGKAASFVPKDYFQTLKELAFGDLALELSALTRESILIGSSNVFNQAQVAGKPASGFDIVPASSLEDQKLYDIIATATVGGQVISSQPIQFGVNTGFTIRKPLPRTLGGILIPTDVISFRNLFVGRAYAQTEGGKSVVELEIDAERPVVTGETEFGSQVYAIWNSVVLSSSVISDSEQGAFEIQAPQNLEKGVPHRVTLYSVKSDGGKTLRSESVNVYFRIKTPGSGTATAAAAAGFSLTLVIAIAVIRRMLKVRNVMRLVKASSHRYKS
jgi:hypothetical protein